MASGLNEFETDFGFSAGIGVAKGNVAGLLFSGFRIFHDHHLSEAYGQIQVDERAVGAESNDIRTFRDVDIVGTTGDDLDGNAEKNALATAPVAMGERLDERGHRRRLEGSYGSRNL